MRSAWRVAVLVLLGLGLTGCMWMFAPPQAVLTATPTSGDAPLSVTFSAAGSTGTIVSFTLDFETDGIVDHTGDNIAAGVTHPYATPGTYTATLVVQDNHGRTDSDTVVITVTAPPQAVLTADDTSGPAPLSVTFSAASSTGTIVSFTLDFETDGIVDHTGDNIAVGVTHPYATPGTYTATLVVDDGRGRTDSDTVVITVTVPPPGTTVTLSALPSSSGPAPLDVVFWANITAAPGRKIVHLSLEYGDGPPADYTADVNYANYNSFLIGADHSYTAPGTYTATLTVTDDAAQATSASVTITVTSPPPVITSFTADNTVEPETLSFTARAGATGRRIVRYTLSFGDTTSLTVEGLNVVHPASLTRTIVHDYLQTGSYTATLRVWDDLHNTAVQTESVTVVMP